MSQLNPGPIDESLLVLQGVHVSQHVWNGAEDRLLVVRRVQQFKDGASEIPEPIVQKLRTAGFLYFAQIPFFTIERPLISALVERWRPETHTFHMPFGECTITLEDVAIIFGLRTSGKAVIGRTHDNWPRYVEQMLGTSPPPEAITGGRLRLSWLQERFDDFSRFSGNEVSRLYYTRAYILRLMGGLMFTDHSGKYVQLRFLPLLEDLEEAGTYSWGSAILGYLYRELCKATDYDRKEIAGAALLIQLWAWARFPSIAPSIYGNYVRPFDSAYALTWMPKINFKKPNHKLNYYRSAFDEMSQEDIVWEPYSIIVATCPSIVVDEMDVWRALVPLICFNIVEWHQPDRVMRQFGMRQHIPGAPSQPIWLHDQSLRSHKTKLLMVKNTYGF